VSVAIEVGWSVTVSGPVEVCATTVGPPDVSLEWTLPVGAWFVAGPATADGHDRAPGSADTVRCLACRLFQPGAVAVAGEERAAWGSIVRTAWSSGRRYGRSSSGSGSGIHSREIGGPLIVSRVADPIFSERRLAEIYDPLDPDRGDLGAYAAIVDEFGARSVLDVGCGTGTFACLLASRGLTVTAVDPAGASLEVARTKPGAGRVRWVHGHLTDLPLLQVDLATMTANVAQVFLTDEDWASTLRAAHAALRPGGRLVFETRDPAAKAWLEWNRERSQKHTVIPGVGRVDAWVEVIDVSGDLVSFRWTFAFESDGALLTSDSTLRFRHRDEMVASLSAAGYLLDEVREAADRPGCEMVFIARRAD
jgi:SAM-dependent methyltransferase